MFDLSGKTALVTGASGGIGGAIARALHAQGAHVVLSGTRQAALDELAAELGERTSVGQACSFLDLGGITIGARTMISPKVTLVTEGHPVEPAERYEFITVAPIVIEADVWIGAAATVLPGVLLQSAYSRQFEQEADDDAARLLRGMGKDPGALGDLLERMQKRICGSDVGCGPSWLGSHPATAERARRLRDQR